MMPIKQIALILGCFALVSCMGPATFKVEQAQLVRYPDGTVNPPRDTQAGGFTPVADGMAFGLHTNFTVQVGMTTDNLKLALGEPDRISTNMDSTIWGYYTGSRRWFSILIFPLPLAGKERWEFVVKSNEVQQILFKSTDAT